MNIEKIEKIENAMKDDNGLVETTELLEGLNSTSFWELINEFKIEIPIIQRDYAQGRDNEKTNKIRQRFLKSMINSVVENNNCLELDFIYGNIEKDVFQPLDGQQRLTTLFLLHWYIAQKLGVLTEHKDVLIKFTYETRISSREFCNELIDKGNRLGVGETITQKIKDSNWFIISWKKDPTIKAMLTTLTSIEELMVTSDFNLFWSKLTSENSPITFHFKELKNIGLTDDLYIKMNARGKELTDFENFKARFEKYISKSCWETKINLTETFSHKIDTVWTDLFWKKEYRDTKNQIDQALIKFIAGIAINYYAQRQDILQNDQQELLVKKLLDNKNKSSTAEAIKRERIERRIAELTKNPNDVNPTDFFQEEAFNYLKKCLDTYSINDNDKLLPENLFLWDFCVESTLFKELIKDGEKGKETTYKQRALFYAQTEYLNNIAEFNQITFSDWMRVVRNIVQNTPIDSPNTFIGAMGLIYELALGSKNVNIYKYLASEKIKSGFASNQIQEEVIKANLIQQSQEWQKQIYKLEDDNFIKGELSFLLLFSKADNEYIWHIFLSLSNAFLLLFEKKDDLLRRALLSLGNYSVWDGYTYSLNSHRYSLLNGESEWKIALKKPSPNLGQTVKALLTLLDDETLSRNGFLNQIINNCTDFNDWRHFIVKDDKILNSCYHKRICITDKALYILEKTRVMGENYKPVKINENN